MSAMTPEFENTLLLATLEKEIELHEVTKQALAAALAEVFRLKREKDLLQNVLETHFWRMERRYIEAELRGTPRREEDREKLYHATKSALLETGYVIPDPVPIPF